MLGWTLGSVAASLDAIGYGFGDKPSEDESRGWMLRLSEDESDDDDDSADGNGTRSALELREAKASVVSLSWRKDAVSQVSTLPRDRDRQIP